jgi:hypothetical protein
MVSIRSNKASGVKTDPTPPCEIWKFWQKEHLREQPVKKTVPDPLSPVMGGSSPKWAPT